MCIVGIKPSGVKMVGEDVIKNCFENNDDGAGFLVADGKEIRISKGHMTVNALLNAMRGNVSVDDLVIFHCRITTHGGTRPQLTHPFPLSQSPKQLKSLSVTCRHAMAHNGIISGFSRTSDESDTMAFVRTILSDPVVYRNIERGSIKTLVEDFVGSSKIAIAHYDKTFSILGDGWIEDGGLLFSNNGYMKKSGKVYTNIIYYGNDNLGARFVTSVGERCHYCGGECVFSCNDHSMDVVLKTCAECGCSYYATLDDTCCVCGEYVEVIEENGKAVMVACSACGAGLVDSTSECSCVLCRTALDEISETEYACGGCGINYYKHKGKYLLAPSFSFLTGDATRARAIPADRHNSHSFPSYEVFSCPECQGTMYLNSKVPNQRTPSHYYGASALTCYQCRSEYTVRLLMSNPDETEPECYLKQVKKSGKYGSCSDCYSWGNLVGGLCISCRADREARPFHNEEKSNQDHSCQCGGKEFVPTNNMTTLVCRSCGVSYTWNGLEYALSEEQDDINYDN